jgi:hypothetical protein
MAEQPGRIALHFADDFLDPTLAGKCMVLDTQHDNKSAWRIGRSKEKCDLVIRISQISRAHCTLFHQFGNWYLMDGVYFADMDEATKELKTAGQYKPSINGTYLDGRKLGYRNPESVTTHSRIVIGHPKCRIFISESDDDTVNRDVWDDGDWPNFKPKTSQQSELAGTIHPAIEATLIEEAIAKDRPAEPVSKPNDIDNQWELIYQIGRWFLATPRTANDFIYRVFIVALLSVFCFKAAQLIELYVNKK